MMRNSKILYATVFLAFVFSTLYFANVDEDNGIANSDTNENNVLNSATNQTKYILTYYVGYGGSVLYGVGSGVPVTTISGYGEIEFDSGSNIILDIKPDSDSLVKMVVVSGGTISSDSSKVTYSSMCQDCTAKIYFANSNGTYTITSSAGEGGKIVPVDEVSVASGSREYKIFADNGYVIEDVKVNGESVGPVESYTFKNIDYNCSISASFKTSNSVFKITTIAEQGGVIIPLSNLARTVGDIEVLANGSLTFKILANEGYAIKDVLLDEVSLGISGTSQIYALENVNDNHTLYAIFSKIYTINAYSGDGGSITPSGDVEVLSGGTQTYNIVVNSGYEISGLYVDGRSVSVSSSYTFSDVADDHTISVSFSKIPEYTISVNASEGGKVIGNTTVLRGGSVKLTVIPDDGYKVGFLSVDGSARSGNAISFSNVTSDHTVSVLFILEGEIHTTVLDNGAVLETMEVVDGNWTISYKKTSMDGSILELDAKAEDKTNHVWAQIYRSEYGNRVEIGGDLLKIPMAGLDIDVSNSAILDHDAVEYAFSALSNMVNYVGNDENDPEPDVIINVVLGGEGSNISSISISHDTLSDLSRKDSTLTIVSSFLVAKYDSEFIDNLNDLGKDVILVVRLCSVDSLSESQQIIFAGCTVIHFAVIVDMSYYESASGTIEVSMPTNPDVLEPITVICADEFGTCTEFNGKRTDSSMSFTVSKLSYYGIGTKYFINGHVEHTTYDYVPIILVLVALVCIISIAIFVKIDAEKRN